MKGYQSLFRGKDPVDGVVAGAEWRQQLFQEVRQCRGLIALCSPAYQQSHWCMAEVAIAVDRGRLVFPLHFGEEHLPLLLQDRQSIALEDAIHLDPAATEEALERLDRGLKCHFHWRDRLSWQPDPPDRSPFPGLRPFEEGDAAVFHGRDEAIDIVCTRLRNLRHGGSALLVLLGSSGCGKSSLVRAGVVPKLRSEEENDWIVLDPFRPLQAPFRQLRQALGRALQIPPGPGPEPHELEPLSAEPNGSADEPTIAQVLMQVDRLRDRRGRAEAAVLVVIDQFEELLSQPSAQAERFLALLGGLVEATGPPLLVLATLRTDFLTALADHPCGLTRLPQVQQELLKPIPPEAIGPLITGPLERLGRHIEGRLLQALLSESRGGGDVLPLLSFSLQRLWDFASQRGGPVLTPSGEVADLIWDDYDHRLGGLRGSVRAAAALAWDEASSERAVRQAVRAAFLQHLVCLGDDDQPARLQARWQDLPLLSWPVLERMVRYRLLVSSGQPGNPQRRVELAHEALLRNWPTLETWLQVGAEKLRQHRRVSRLCAELALSQPPQARLAALQGLVVLTEADPQVAATAADALAAVLTEAERDPQEWPLAIHLLTLVGGEASVAALSAFLEQRQLPEPTETKLAAPLLEALCQAAAALQTIHCRTPPCDDKDERWLLLPSATLNVDLNVESRAVRTQLVRLRLWSTPMQEAPGAWFEPLGEGVVLTMVAIPAGSFVIGSPLSDTYGKDIDMPPYNASRPQHLVSLKDFWISQAPITQAQWLQVMGHNPSYFISNRGNSDQRPVEQVSWHDAMKFCRLLGERTGRTYTLPSESQWEYACRAGTTTHFHFGNGFIRELANFGTLTIDEYKRENQDQTSSVGQFPANAWGLHDMHGNVEEWCLDEWHSSYEGAPADGSAWVDLENNETPVEPKTRILRGGSWDKKGMDLFCRSAFRARSFRIDVPESVSSGVGFRVVCLP